MAGASISRTYIEAVGLEKLYGYEETDTNYNDSQYEQLSLWGVDA
jgi:hypothetical protein